MLFSYLTQEIRFGPMEAQVCCHKCDCVGANINYDVQSLFSCSAGSSAMIGFFAETGPFRIQEDMTLKKNPHSWTRLANMLFIDHPVCIFV